MGSVTLLAFCMTVTKLSVKSICAIAVRGCCHRHSAAVFVRAGGAAPGDFDDAFLVGHVREGIEIAEVVLVFRRKDCARDDDAVAEHRRDRIESFAAVERQAETVQILDCGLAASCRAAELEASGSRSH